MKFHCVSLIAILAAATPTPAQTVTVNQAGTGTYTSISAAISSFASDTDPAPNIIQITDGAVYSETITIDSPLTLEATGSSATLALLPNPLGTASKGGIFINLPSTLTTGTVTLKNLNIIPDASTTSNLLSTAIENGNNNLCLILENTILSANFNNQPYVTNGWKNDVLRLIPTQATYDPSIVQFGDDGIVLGGNTNGEFEGDGVELIFKDSILTHFRRDYVEATLTPFGIIMENPYGNTPPYPNLTRITRILGNSAVSFCDQSLYIAGDLEIDNLTAPRIQMRGSKTFAIRLTGPSPNFRKIKGLIVEGSSYGISDDGFGSIRPTISNSIFWQILNQIIVVRKPTNDTATGTFTLENTTMAGGRQNTTSNHVYRFETNTQTNVLLKDSIIAGRLNQPTNANNVFSVAGTNAVTLQGTAIVTNGPYALRATGPFSPGANVTFLGAASTAADPQFQNIESTSTAYPSNPGLMNVSNPEYANKNSTGAPLGGGAQYVGNPSAITDWAQYAALNSDQIQADRRQFISLISNPQTLASPK